MVEYAKYVLKVVGAALVFWLCSGVQGCQPSPQTEPFFKVIVSGDWVVIQLLSKDPVQISYVQVNDKRNDGDEFCFRLLAEDAATPARLLARGETITEKFRCGPILEVVFDSDDGTSRWKEHFQYCPQPLPYPLGAHCFAPNN